MRGLNGWNEAEGRPSAVKSVAWLAVRPRIAGLVLALTYGLSPSAPSSAAQPAPTPVAIAAPSPDGDWDGVLEIRGFKLRVAFHIHTVGGTTTATLDSLDQNAMGLPVTSAGVTGAKVRLEMTRLGAVFEGEVSPDGATLTGEFTQGGLTVPLRLTRRTGAAPATLRRPRTPTPPFPYRAEEVAFDSAPGVRLAGTLTLPPGAGPFPVAVLIWGSGDHDRDETLFGHKPFLVLADALTRRGVAVLRFDKRGVGGSSGRSADATTADYARDVTAAVAFLRTRAELDPGRIGLIGHSEGGIIAPLVAAEDSRIAFVVMMAGSGVPGDQLLLAQSRALMTANGAPAARIEAQTALNRQLYDLEKSDLDTATETARAEAALLAAGVPAKLAHATAVESALPWMRWFVRYDPRPALGRLRQPVLAMNGSKDLQVVAGQNLPAIRQALKDDPDVTVTELPGLNHLFQTAGTGSPDEYARIEETIAPAALDLIVDWVARRKQR